MANKPPGGFAEDGALATKGPPGGFADGPPGGFQEDDSITPDEIIQPIEAGAKEVAKTLGEDFSFVATLGLSQHPKLEGGRVELGPTMKRVATAIETPMRLYRGALVGAEKKSAGASTSESFERAKAAVSPFYEPKTGEKGADFIASALDPAFLAFGGSAAKVGLTSLKAGAAEGAKIAAVFSALHSAQKKDLGPEDAANIAMATGFGAVIGLVAQAAINKYVSNRLAKSIQPPDVPPGGGSGGGTPDYVPSEAARNARKSGVGLPDDSEAYRRSLESKDILNRQEAPFTPEAKTNISQMKDFRQQQLEKIRQAPQSLGLLRGKEEEVARSQADMGLAENRIKYGVVPGKDTPEIRTAREVGLERANENPTWAKPPKVTEFRSEKAALEHTMAPGKGGRPPEIIGIRSSGIPLRDAQTVAQHLDDPAKPVEMDIPDIDTFLADFPEHGVIDPMVTDIQRASMRKASGLKPGIKLERPASDTGVAKPWQVKYQVAPAVDKAITATEKRIAAETATSPIAVESGLPAQTLESSTLLPYSRDILSVNSGNVAGSSNYLSMVMSRATRSFGAALRKSGGPIGDEFANRIQLYEDIPRVRLGDFMGGFNKMVARIKRRDWDKAAMALADGLEGKPNDYKLPEGMIDYARLKLHQIAEEGESLGLRILRADGKEVPFAERSNYFPRFLKEEVTDALLSGGEKASVQSKKIAEKMVKEGKAPNFEVATENVRQWISRMRTRRYGNLERAREIDLPDEFYDRNSFRVLTDYFEGAYKRLEEVRQFGRRDEVAQKLWGMMREQGSDWQLAQKGFERLVGIELQDEITKKTINGARSLISSSLIQFPSTVLQTGQFLTPITHTTGRGVGAFIDAFYRGGKNFAKALTSAGKAEAEKSGQIFEGAVSQYITELYGESGGAIGKLAAFSSKASGFGPLDSFLRTYSSLMGKEWIGERLVPRIVKNVGDNYAKRELLALGLNPEAISKAGGLTSMELDVASKRFSDLVQGSPRLDTLPLWASSPGGKLLTQFKTFAFVLTKENVSMVQNAVATGNVPKLAMIFGATPSFGYLIQKIREKVWDAKPMKFTGNEETDAYLNAMANATTLSLLFDLGYATKKGGYAIQQMFTPPVVSVGAKTIGDMSLLLQGNKKAAGRLLGRVPVVGRTLQTAIQ